ncbi:Alcohol dehydrogenase superfamily, zinc-type [Corchorus olitorius]|uniref:Probable quinone oxidoreductase n=1 Tax=Corchorus olitorius TaxID=93759 RepID=A0A1R3JTN8_9ROSI|nr:Alcohol dehydrogenase superfamily, zinc-type [Corchorus olitorius]
MVKAIRVYEHGGPEVLKWEDVELGEPREGEIRVKNKVVGLNFIDVYFRKGVYKPATMPFTPGAEAVGEVTAVGPGVTGTKVGDVVAFAQMGSYAEEQIIPADKAIPVPPSLDPIIVASFLTKGMTVQYLVRRTFKVEPGHTVLVHAAAGGTGSLLCQWANALGATVIGTVSTKEKAAQAKEDGCHHVILYTEEDFVARVNEITSGSGVEVVYDSVGKDTFQGSLACLKPRGYMVSFGQSSGTPDPVPLSALAAKSLFLTRPSLRFYTPTRDELLKTAEEVFANVASGTLRVRVNHRYPLSQVAEAHADLENRRTSGLSGNSQRSEYRNRGRITTEDMVKAIRVHQHGGPEVLKWEDVELGELKEGEMRIKNKAIGLNFLDVYYRKGVLKTATMPFTPGYEAVGEVVAMGPGVTGRKVGDLVGYAYLSVGSYAEEQILPADLVVPIPPSIDPVFAASILLKGMTAQYLVRRTFKVEAGHIVLVHAAAGGTGSLLCQWANALGATVIGTVSTKEKAAQAKEDGCHQVILYKEEDFVSRVNEITSGKGVEVVYDSVGKDTLQGSLACLKPRGYLVNFGMASGEPDPIPLSALGAKSLMVTMTSMRHHIGTREELVETAREVFEKVASGVLQVRVNHKYPLSQAAQAHADLENRRTSGSVVLIP